MVIPHASDLVEPLIRSAGHQSLAGERDAQQEGAVGFAVRILDPGRPVLAPGLRPHGAHVPAHIESDVLVSGGLQRPGGLFGGIALGNGAQVYAHLRIGQLGCAVRRVEDHVPDVRVLRGIEQLRVRGDARRGAGERLLAAVVPQRKHRTHGDVAHPVGGVVHLPPEFEQLHQLRTDAARPFAGQVVESPCVDLSGVFVVYIPGPVIAFQDRLNDGAHLVKGLNAPVHGNGGNGIKPGVVRLSMLLLRPAAGKIQAEEQRRRGSDGGGTARRAHGKTPFLCVFSSLQHDGEKVQ